MAHSSFFNRRHFIFREGRQNTAGTSAEVHLAPALWTGGHYRRRSLPEVQGHQPRNYEGPEGRRRSSIHHPLPIFARSSILHSLVPFKFCFERQSDR